TTCLSCCLFQGHGDQRDRHSFPTRRSSDLRVGTSIEITLKSELLNRNITGSHILIATGRSANTAALELEKAGVNTSKGSVPVDRSEEHTSELQSRENLVCRLLLEKKKMKKS